MARPLVINRQYTIPAKELSLTFARSAGPGGQNVNKVNSKALLRWDFRSNQTLPEDVRVRFQRLYEHRINQSGEVLLASDRHRDQPRNIEDCYNRLRQLIAAVLTPPAPRKKTRPSRGAVERRLQSKRQSSQRKARRRFRPGTDD